MGDEGQIKKKLFLEAKSKLREFLSQENIKEDHVEMVVCEGTPFLEINKKAVENNVDMIIIGSCGKIGDMEQIFFWKHYRKSFKIYHATGALRPSRVRVPNGLTTIMHIKII